MINIFRSIAMVNMLTISLCSADTMQASRKYYSDANASVMSFVLLNYSRLVHEIEFGRGEYVESLMTQKKNSNMNLMILRKLTQSNQDTYTFAKAVVEYR